MKFGAHSLMWTPSFSEEDLEIFDKLKSFGFEGIEILMDDLETLPVKGIKQKMEETGMGVACSVALDGRHNPISSDPETRRKAVEFLKSRINTAADLGAEIATGVVYAAWGEFTGKQRTDEEWEWCKETLWKVTDLLEETGVTLGIEAINRYETYFINTAEDAKRLVKEIDHPSIKVHLDTYHMNIEEKSFYEAIKIVGDDLCHLHLCENDRGVPGTGHVDWNGIFKALNEINYDGWAVVESFVPAIEEIARQTAIWRQVAPSADELAKQSLKFFKKNVRS